MIAWISIGMSLLAIGFSIDTLRMSRKSYLDGCARRGETPLTFWQIISGRRP